MKKLLLISALSYAMSISTFAYGSATMSLDIEQGIAAYESGNLAQAANLLTKGGDEDFNKYLYLAKIALDNKNLDQAEDLIEQALSLNNTNGDIYFVHGQIMAAQSENVNMFSKMSYAKDIVKAFSKAVLNAPDNIKYRQSLLTVHLVAPSIIGGDTDVALAQAKAIEALDARAGAVALMKVYAKLEQHDRFDEIYNTAVIDFPDEPAVFYVRGMYFQQQEQFDHAVDELTKAASISALSAQQRKSQYMAMYQIGRTSVLSKSYLDEGEQALSQYIASAEIQDMMPTKEWAKYRLANIVEYKGEVFKAKELYQELIQETHDKELKSKAKKRARKLG
ncbi:tetratricopeptide repeat protein [Colwelliaceae bacterium 6471]